MKLKIKDTFKKTVAIMMNQMSAKWGIKKHGVEAIKVIFKEYAQLDYLEVFKLIVSMKLTEQQKKDALELITVVKEKICGTLKGRVCANGNKHKRYIPKEESASPVVSLESLLLSLLIDAKEKRDTATADVAGEFLKELMEDLVLIKLKNEEVKIMCDVNEKYKAHVIKEGNDQVLYVLSMDV